MKLNPKWIWATVSVNAFFERLTEQTETKSQQNFSSTEVESVWTSSRMYEGGSTIFAT